LGNPARENVDSASNREWLDDGQSPSSSGYSEVKAAQAVQCKPTTSV